MATIFVLITTFCQPFCRGLTVYLQSASFCAQLLLEGEKQKLFVFKVQGQSVHPGKQTALSGQFVNEGTSTARPRPQLFIQVGNTRQKTPVGWEGGRGEGGGEVWGRGGKGRGGEAGAKGRSPKVKALGSSVAA